MAIEPCIREWLVRCDACPTTVPVTLKTPGTLKQVIDRLSVENPAGVWAFHGSWTLCPKCSGCKTAGEEIGGQPPNA